MEKRNYIPSFLVAYLLSIKGLNQVMGIVLKKSDGIMVMNLIPVAALIALHFFISNKKRDLNMDKRALLFVYYIVSVVVIYKYAYRYSTLPYIEFLVYCFIPIYISFYKVDVEKMLKYMMLFSTLVIPISNEFFKDLGYAYETIGMSTTYNVLPFVIAAAIHFIYYREKAGFWLWLCYGINIYYLLKVIYLGNRGPIITLIVCALLVIMHKQNPDGTIRKSPGKTVFITLSVGVVSILVVSNIESIIISVYRWLQSMDIEIAFVSKSITKINKGDLSNGRSNLFDFVIQGIRENYLAGNGISSIYYKSFGRYIYPHNLFLQMWYDLGIIVSLPLLFLVGRSIKKTVFDYNISKETITMLILLFTLSIPRLCYSAEFWTNSTFWFLIIFTVSPNIYADNVILISDEKEVNEGKN